jgi:hypothetical protein
LPAEITGYCHRSCYERLLNQNGTS